MTTQYELRFVPVGDPIFVELVPFRYQVLYEPYGVPPTFGWDDMDPDSEHLVAFVRGRLAGYGRLVGRGSEAQIRHLCVGTEYRGTGLGGTLLDTLISRAREKGATLVFLNARFTALGMYRARGFVEVGEMFHTEHTHLPHKRMELQLV